MNRLYELLAHPHSTAFLSQALHMCERQVEVYLNSVGETEWGHVRIVGWHVRRQGYPTPYYAFGFGPDLPMPDRRGFVTSSMASKARLARLRADPEKMQAFYEKRRARERKPRRDKATLALFGKESTTESAHQSV